MDNLQTRIQNLLDRLVGEGTERGVQVALYLRGQLVVDACAGVANVHTGERVASDTLFPVFSTTKGMMAAVVHRLVEQGNLDYETPIAELWPEFAANGKEGITIRHALNHTSGLPLMPLDARQEDFSDWEAMCHKIAALEPISAPGERTEYHAITYGYLLGESVCRASGRDFSSLWHEELCAPLGVQDEMFCGLPASCKATVAWLEEPNGVTLDAPEVPTAEAIPFWLWPLGEWMNKPDSQRAVVPASTGIMSARAIARFYASLLPGGAEGVELLTPERLSTILAPQPARWQPEEGEGFALGFAKMGTAFGHYGYGGSVGMADPAGAWAFAFTHNLFQEDNRESVQLILAEVKNSLPLET